MDRRKLLLSGAAWMGAGASLPAWADSKASKRRPPVTPPTPSTPPKSRVIVIGGGMAGATVAKYLRLWGDAVEVTLVERAASYTSCIMSSLVLTGQRTMASLNFTYDTLRSKYGVVTVFGEVVAVDPVNVKVTLAGGQVLTADRIVMAPGIEFDPVPGLTDTNVMPHAWKAGPQTSLLAQQLAAMPASGQVVLTIPKAPYRCPPGPYERACLIADWIRVRKPQGKLIVLDANPDFVAERDNFSQAFLGLHGNVIEYRNNVVIDSVDQASKTLFTNTGAVRGDVVNLIPSQRAGGLVAATGLNNATGGRFAGVNVLDYSSTAAPKIHVIGDSSATTQPKAGHIANQEAKVCADALVRMLHALFQYDPATAAMVAVPTGTGASVGWNSEHFKDMGQWFSALMADSFA